MASNFKMISIYLIQAMSVFGISSREITLQIAIAVNFMMENSLIVLVLILASKQASFILPSHDNATIN